MTVLSFDAFCATRRAVDDLRLHAVLADNFEGEPNVRPGLIYTPTDFPLYIEGPDENVPGSAAYLLTIGNSGWTGATPSDLEPELYGFYLCECADGDTEEWAAARAAAPANRYFGLDDAGLVPLTPASPPSDPNLLPQTITFEAAFLAVFGLVVENGYEMLDDDDFEGHDADEVREQLDMAISEAAQCFTPRIGVLTAEKSGALADIVLGAYTELNEFLIETTDREG